VTAISWHAKEEERRTAAASLWIRAEQGDYNKAPRKGSTRGSALSTQESVEDITTFAVLASAPVVSFLNRKSSIVNGLSLTPDS
jgi:hypothetical protein